MEKNINIAEKTAHGMEKTAETMANTLLAILDKLAGKESDLKLRDLFRALHDFKAGGRILCESPIMETDALYMKKVWQEVSGE